jgi:hypothetical protein
MTTYPLGPTAISPEWAKWLGYVSVDDDDEDLAEVFQKVRLQMRIATQVEWARDWRTRTFCDLALYLLYEQHIRRVPGSRANEITIFANIEPSKLADLADKAGFFKNSEDAGELSAQRFRDTWGNQAAFCEDLLAYLFRPAPYLRRLARLHPALIAATEQLTLGQSVRHTAKTELDSVLTNPLVSLHTFVETVLPKNPYVQDAVHRLRLQRWADLYEQVFTAYGAPLRADQGELGWLDMAERFSTVAGGSFVRAQTRPGGSDSGADGEMLGQIVVDMLPAMLLIEAGDIESRRLQQPVTVSG